MRRGMFASSAGALAMSVGGYVFFNHCLVNVEGGHRAVIYNRCLCCLFYRDRVGISIPFSFLVPWLYEFRRSDLSMLTLPCVGVCGICICWYRCHGLASHFCSDFTARQSRGNEQGGEGRRNTLQAAVVPKIHHLQRAIDAAQHQVAHGQPRSPNGRHQFENHLPTTGRQAS